MSINPRPKRASAWTLVEAMVGVGVFSISGLALATIFLFCIRSFAALTNYAVLDKANRQAMDTLVKEIRQAQYVVSYTSNATSRALTLVNGDNLNVTYTFDSGTQQFTRDDGTSKMLLTNCNLLNFQLYKRPVTNGSWGNFDVTSTNYQQYAKVIELTWKTSMNICPTAQINSEDVQTAKVVIRKQRGI
jgi:Tfp pilus assembly protein PilV